jgi:hypothetical protein
MYDPLQTNVAARASRLHGMKSWHRAAQKTAVLRLPPGIDDDRLALGWKNNW